MEQHDVRRQRIWTVVRRLRRIVCHIWTFQYIIILCCLINILGSMESNHGAGDKKVKNASTTLVCRRACLLHVNLIVCLRSNAFELPIQFNRMLMCQSTSPRACLYVRRFAIHSNNSCWEIEWKCPADMRYYGLKYICGTFNQEHLSQCILQYTIIRIVFKYCGAQSVTFSSHFDTF